VIDTTASRPSYRRIPFELEGDAPARGFADPTGVSWQDADDDEVLVGLLGRALQSSIDPRDEREVRLHGAGRVAAQMVDDARSSGVYECERAWWSIVAVDGEAAGVVLPVIFAGCAKDGRDEATLYHLAVLPQHRGRGLGHLLLGRATDVLLSHGVWQISCDTAIENAPMVHLFETQNWARRQPVDIAR
jgi:ribosomal protein S18 acetylase RimI-like enzyme